MAQIDGMTAVRAQNLRILQAVEQRAQRLAQQVRTIVGV